MLTLVFGMEEGMRAFYERLSKAVADQDAAALFRELSELEVHHKQGVFDLYRTRGGPIGTIEAMESEASREVMEGGLDPDDVVEAIQPRVKSVEDVLSYAMMLETQALDLCLRFSQHSEDEATAKMLLEMADEEKGHLKLLGDLMEERVRRP
jgi:sulfur-carrier protein adenylyltransferase/sulfurtransferase